MIRHLALLFSILILTLSASAQEFEGSVSFKMSAGGRSSEMKHFLKGQKMRLEMNSARGARTIALSDYQEKAFYLLMPQTKIFMRLNLDNEKLASAAEQSLRETELVETKESQEILGYNCKKWVGKQGENEIEIWIAKGFGTFYQLEGSAQNSALASLKKHLEKEKGFPFRVIQRSPSGAQLYKLEVTEVKKESLPEQLFEIPEDYKEMDVTQLKR